MKAVRRSQAAGSSRKGETYGSEENMGRAPETVSAADRLCGKAETDNCRKRVKQEKEPDNSFCPAPDIFHSSSNRSSNSSGEYRVTPNPRKSFLFRDDIIVGYSEYLDDVEDIADDPVCVFHAAKGFPRDVEDIRDG